MYSCQERDSSVANRSRHGQNTEIKHCLTKQHCQEAIKLNEIMREDWKIIQSDSILWAHKISFKQAEDTFQNSFQIEFKLTPYFWKLYFFYSAQLIQKLFFSDKIPMTNFFSQKMYMIFKSVHLWDLRLLNIWGKSRLLYRCISINLNVMEKFISVIQLKLRNSCITFNKNPPIHSLNILKYGDMPIS